MKRQIAILGLVGLGMGLAACGSNAALGPLEASGFIEADEISIVAETGGRVAEVLADEGDTVEAGQVLLRLDDSLLQPRRTQAEAALTATRALRDEEVNGPRPELLTQADGNLAKARLRPDSDSNIQPRHRVITQ